MWSPDFINSLFLGVSALLIGLNVRRVYKDKKVAGVSLLPSTFFSIWGVWDLYYFPHLDQWFSMGASLIAVAMNTTWLYLAWSYRQNERHFI